ncbi:hypothetical protein [Flavobacterium sp.]|uniref:hypothetical protein n=1 Tax=Flavobacterium sp. TaxID=239 RepID=UPI002FD95D8E
MKKIITTVFSLFFLIGCQSSSSDLNEIKKEVSKGVTSKSFYDIEVDGYRGQLPYLENHNSDNINEFSLKINIEENINKSEYNWQYFDSLYKHDLPIYDKQRIAFVILVKKDLIEIVKNHPNEQNLIDKLKFYTSTLIETKSIGYCVLYHALQIINLSDREFTKNAAHQIIQNSINDDFYKNYNLTTQEINNIYEKKNT